MCGGHGIHRLISLAEAEISESHSSKPDGLPIDLENEVMLMYARGEIGPEAFRRLHTMAQKRELKIQDLGAFQFGSVDNPHQSVSGQIKGQESRSAYSRELQQQRRHLEAACAETEESIRRLKLEIALLYQEAEATDEKSEISARAVSRAESVEQRMRLIGERLSHLKSHLADVVTQQRLLES